MTLNQIRERVEALQRTQSKVTLIYKDGTKKDFPLRDVIPLMQYPQVENVAEIVGENGTGHLLDLLRGLLC